MNTVIAYYFIQSFYKGYEPKHMPVKHMTHAIYAFLDITPEGECGFINDRPKYTDKDQVIISQFKALKAKHKHLKTLLSIGGSVHSVRFSDVSLTPESREKFARSCVKIMKQYNFDGFDLDWEVVGFKTKKNPNSKPEDAKNFVALADEFRKQMPIGSLLSAAVSPEAEFVKYLDIKNLSRSLDWFNIMSYDFCGDWSKHSCHHSEFVQTGKKGIDTFLNEGARKDQIVLGIPFYGHYWKVESTDNNGIGQKIIQSTEKNYYEEYVSYVDIKKDYLNKNGFSFHFDEKFFQPLLVNKKEKVVISFDNEKSIKFKAKKAKEAGYRGLMMWEISEDDEQGSLLKAMNGQK